MRILWKWSDLSTLSWVDYLYSCPYTTTQGFDSCRICLREKLLNVLLSLSYREDSMIAFFLTNHCKGGENPMIERFCYIFDMWLLLSLNGIMNKDADTSSKSMSVNVLEQPRNNTTMWFHIGQHNDVIETWNKHYSSVPYYTRVIIDCVEIRDSKGGKGYGMVRLRYVVLSQQIQRIPLTLLDYWYLSNAKHKRPTPFPHCDTLSAWTEFLSQNFVCWSISSQISSRRKRSGFDQIRQTVFSIPRSIS